MASVGVQTVTDDVWFLGLASFLGISTHLLAACADARAHLDDLEARVRGGDPDVIQVLRDRYNAGRDEHADSPDNWRGWTRDRFKAETVAEIHDAVIYAAEARRRGLT
jgi:hypothetical protein